MKIQSVDKTNYSFKGVGLYNITKSLVSSPQIKASDLTNIIDSVNKQIANEHSVKKIKDVIAQAGIKDIHSEYNQISVTTNKGVTCLLPYPVRFDIPMGENLVANEFFPRKAGSCFLGLKNYLSCVSDVKNFSLFKKGLSLQSSEFDVLSNDTRTALAQKMSLHLRQNISPNEMFYMDGEALYYDDIEKTVYSIAESSCKLKKSKVKSCKFIYNNEGCAVGYENEKYDLLQNKMLKTLYYEQQQPSHKLPDVVQIENRTEVAEAFRFGNNQKDNVPYGIRYRILYDLKKHTQFDLFNADNIKTVNLLQKGTENIRYSYFKCDTNSSYIYNEKGDFLYQVKYLYDDNGNIIDFYKI